jgi:hypothetical protein
MSRGTKCKRSEANCHPLRDLEEPLQQKPYMFCLRLRSRFRGSDGFSLVLAEPWHDKCGFRGREIRVWAFWCSSLFPDRARPRQAGTAQFLCSIQNIAEAYICGRVREQRRDMCASKYLWQQAVSDAFEASPESLPAKINAAERAIAARLIDPNEADAFERRALDEALRSLKKLVEETRRKSAPQHVSHFHIKWSGGALDWERFRTHVEAENAAELLVRSGEAYTIEQYGEQCPACAEVLTKRSAGSSA